MTQQTIKPLSPVLTPRQLKGFDRRRVALIREMESYGWRGRRGKKTHMIMRAPDGVTTDSISPKVTADPRGELNVNRVFRNWVNRLEVWGEEISGGVRLDQPITFPEADGLSVLVALTQTVPVSPIRRTRTPSPAAEVFNRPAPQPVDTVQAPVAPPATSTTCSLCEKVFGTLQALSVHRHRAHSRVACEVCDRPMAPTNLPRHMQQHVDHLGTHEQVMAEVLRLRAELARVRTERSEWQTMAETTEAEYVELQQGLRALTER